MTDYKKWTLAKHPSGVPSEDCFALESFTPDAPQEGQVLIKTHYFSLDPGMRGRLSGDSYAAGLKIGDTIESAGIGEIIASGSERFAVGDMVMGGLGWTEGSQAQLKFLPEGHTDFIIAVLAEEFGFLGVLGLFMLYAAVLLRGLRITWTARSTFGRLLAGALVITFFFGLVVNLGMVSGVLPVVGVPLPLVSYGGTAMLSVMVAFGMLMAIASERSVTRTDQKEYL